MCLSILQESVPDNIKKLKTSETRRIKCNGLMDELMDSS